MKFKLTLLFCLLFFNLYSQKTKFSVDSSKSKMTINGTSTLHDWSTEVKEIMGSLYNGKEANVIDSLKLEFDVFSISSGKKKMDKDTYKSLNASTYSTIQFKMLAIQLGSDDKNNATINGNLTVAGVTQNIDVVTKIYRSNDSVRLQGTHTLKMTSFDINPPKALLGVIKTGDEVELSFDLNFY